MFATNCCSGQRMHLANKTPMPTLNKQQKAEAFRRARQWAREDIEEKRKLHAELKAQEAWEAKGEKKARKKATQAKKNFWVVFPGVPKSTEETETKQQVVAHTTEVEPHTDAADMFFDTVEAIQLHPPPTAPVNSHGIVDGLLSRLDTLETRLSHMERKDRKKQTNVDWERLVPESMLWNHNGINVVRIIRWVSS